MCRTKLRDRQLPDYTKAEEIFHAVSHLIGAVGGIAALILCLNRCTGLWSAVGCSIYGCSLILLYLMSGLYHALPKGPAKKVLQILDHCTIYLLIAGTYTPVLFCAIRPVSPMCAWILFALVWGCSVVGCVFTSIDVDRYDKPALICYIAMGWCIVIAAPIAIRAIALPGLLWLLAGGIAYTVGAVFYAIGRKRRRMHAVFHVFVLAGSLLQLVSIAGYIL